MSECLVVASHNFIAKDALVEPDGDVCLALQHQARASASVYRIVVAYSIEAKLARSTWVAFLFSRATRA